MFVSGFSRPQRQLQSAHEQDIHTARFHSASLNLTPPRKVSLALRFNLSALLQNCRDTFAEPSRHLARQLSVSFQCTGVEQSIVLSQ